MDDEKKPIPYLSLDHILDEDFLSSRIYRSMDREYYWSDHWDRGFYIAQARAGFIAVAMDHEQLGPILLPEMQTAYAVLDWENLHVSRKVKKLLNRSAAEPGRYELTFCDDPGEVIRSVRKQFGAESWLTDDYESLIYQLSASRSFQFHTIELREKGVLTAGELGYTCGRVYTSLTGFSSRKKEHNNHGNLQMVLLANRLKKSDYAFWNMGHPYMDYKFAIGAKVLARDVFLKKWTDNI